jgi:4-hydroxy-tetrahydrodipicolinate reductase
MIKVAVLGAGGRMGRLVCQTIVEDPDLDLVAAIGGSGAGHRVGDLIGRQDTDLTITTGLDALTEGSAEVAVDFTRPDAVMANLRRIVPLGVHVVVGTSGLGPDDLDEIRSLVEGGPANAMVVPNFAVGAVLLQRFAAQAARFFPAAEVVELHHDGKADAPSGTALATARRMWEARGSAWRPTPTEETVRGVRGGDVHGVRVHSVRLPGLVGHQEVLLGGEGEVLTLRHDSLSRTSFLPGVALAIKAVPSRPGLTVGLEDVLGLDAG